jgi:DNA-binding response OmpR family regulator
MVQNNKPSVLIIEDDRRLSLINSSALESDGYDITAVFTLREARFALARTQPDVILLDVKMPDGNGFAFCREIREQTPAYIIFLTSVTESEGEFEGLVAGGDDYLRKPYGIELLQERVKKALHRKGTDNKIFTKGVLKLHIASAQAYANGEDLGLTPREFALLLCFAQNENKILTADKLYETVWGRPSAGDNRALQSRISALRKKLAESGCRIASEYGKGYSFYQC